MLAGLAEFKDTVNHTKVPAAHPRNRPPSRRLPSLRARAFLELEQWEAAAAQWLFPQKNATRDSAL